MVMTDAAGISEVGFLGKGADIKIKTDRNGLIWPYFSKSDMTKYVSARDVLSGTADPALIKGKLTIVGTSAAGLLEIRATPVDPVIPGVEIHAQLIEAILHQTYLSRPSNVEGAELALIVIVGLLMIWLIPRVTARLSLMAPLLVAASLIGFSWYSFVAERILLDVSFAILTILVLTLFLTYTAYVRAAKLVRIVRESGSPAGAEDIQGPRAEAGKAPSSAASIQSEDIETVYATRRPQGSVDRQIVSGSYLLVPLAILLGLIVIFFVVVVTTCSNV
jgi:adenylate cyclase